MSRLSPAYWIHGAKEELVPTSEWKQKTTLKHPYNSRPTDHQQSADRLLTVGRQITNSRPTVSEGSCSSQLPDKQSLIKVVNALVFSRLYGSSVWCNTSKKSITKLQNVQNSASCTITNTKKYDQTCNASFEAVGLEYVRS